MTRLLNFIEFIFVWKWNEKKNWRKKKFALEKIVFHISAHLVMYERFVEIIITNLETKFCQDINEHFSKNRLKILIFFFSVWASNEIFVSFFFKLDNSLQAIQKTIFCRSCHFSIKRFWKKSGKKIWPFPKDSAHKFWKKKTVYAK